MVGDAGFPLKTYLMKPFSKGQNYGVREKVFNYRLSRARRIVECASGTLQKRWRVLDQRLCCLPKNVDKIIMAVLALHNFLLMEDSSSYLDEEEDDEENEIYSEEPEEQEMQNPFDDLISAVNMGDTVADYFVSPAGRIPWQWEKAHV